MGKTMQGSSMKTAELNTMQETYREVRACRICGGDNLTVFWEGGLMPIVEFPLMGQAPSKPKVPLTLAVCEDCWLVQLRHTANPKYLYSEFWYRSGIQEAMQNQLRDIAMCADRESLLMMGDCVLDIGCNDGTLLGMYPSQGAGLVTVGIDPAQNIVPVFFEEHKRPKFVWDYFSEKVALQASGGKRYHIVTAIAMMYDLDDPVDFVSQVKNVLEPTGGIFIVQMNYLPTMLESNGVDNVCHEHVTYFSLTTLKTVFEKAGLDIYKVELNETNGGSLRVYACHFGSRKIHRSVRDLLRKETEQGLNTMRPYERFTTNVDQVVRWVNRLLERFEQGHKNVYAYGASTRGTTLLQLLNIKGKIIACAERNPDKFGRYMVGSELPIVSEEKARQGADIFLILPWAFTDSFVKRESEWLSKGGKFIVPLPEPRVIADPGAEEWA
jgi:2-polyprenyl-3-methyl-5-hydroxy-6-metoxy-1,4-benzoquinol methylase